MWSDPTAHSGQRRWNTSASRRRHHLRARLLVLVVIALSIAPTRPTGRDDADRTRQPSRRPYTTRHNPAQRAIPKAMSTKLTRGR